MQFKLTTKNKNKMNKLFIALLIALSFFYPYSVIWSSEFKASQSRYCEANLMNVFSGVVNGCVAQMNSFGEIVNDSSQNNNCNIDKQFALVPGQDLTIEGLKNMMSSLPSVYETHKVKGTYYGYLNILNPKTGAIQNITFSSKLKNYKNSYVGMTETGLFLRLMGEDKLRVHGGFGLLEFDLNCYSTKYDAYTNTLNKYFLDEVKFNNKYNFINDVEYQKGFGGARSMIGGRLHAIEYDEKGNTKIAALENLVPNYWKGVNSSKVFDYTLIKNETLDENFYSNFLEKMKEKNRISLQRQTNKDKTPKQVVKTESKSEFPLKPIPINFPSVSVKRDDIAVIIGNANYKKQGKDIPNVNPAYADAEGIKKYFMKAKGIKEGNIIYLKDATGSQLLGVFGNEKSHKGKLFNYIKPKKSNVYVYYAGHGAPGEEGDAYLVPTDTDSQTIEFTGYPLSTLYSNLGKLPAKSMTVILEACFSGGSQSGSLISKASPIIIQPKKTMIPNNIKVIAAGSERQMASWEEDSSHSLFTKYFLKAMSGEGDTNKDGKVSDNELKEYLSDTMTYYARRYYGRDQKVQIHNGD